MDSALMSVLTGSGVAVLAMAAADVTPVDAAGSSITGYLLGYGPIAVFLLALAWLMFKGWRLVPPGHEAKARDEARKDARADLLAERDRLIREKDRAEEERDEALRIARDQMVPLLSSFVATTSTLVPLLQEIVLAREPPSRRRRGGPDP